MSDEQLLTFAEGMEGHCPNYDAQQNRIRDFKPKHWFSVPGSSF
jgi:hypothetical protein